MIGKILEKRYVILEPVGADGAGFRYIAYDMTAMGRVQLRVDPDAEGQLSGACYTLAAAETPLEAAPPSSGASESAPLAAAPKSTEPLAAAIPAPTPERAAQGQVEVPPPHRTILGIPSPHLRRESPAETTQPIDLEAAEEVQVIPATELKPAPRQRLRSKVLEAAWFAHGDFLDEGEEVPEEVPEQPMSQEDLELQARRITADTYRRYALELSPPAPPPQTALTPGAPVIAPLPAPPQAPLDSTSRQEPAATPPSSAEKPAAAEQVAAPKPPAPAFAPTLMAIPEATRPAAHTATLSSPVAPPAPQERPVPFAPLPPPAAATPSPAPLADPLAQPAGATSQPTTGRSGHDFSSFANDALRWLLHSRPGLLVIGSLAGVLVTSVTGWLLDASPAAAPVATSATSRQKLAADEQAGAITPRPAATPAPAAVEPPSPASSAAGAVQPADAANSAAKAEQPANAAGEVTAQEQTAAPAAAAAPERKLTVAERRRLRTYLIRARRAARTRKWRAAYSYAEKALALQPGNSRAAAIKAQAQDKGGL